MEGMEMAFAYGSGVFQQEGHVDMSKNMLDYNNIKSHHFLYKVIQDFYFFLSSSSLTKTPIL
jgi:hypothetical protein